MINLLPPKEKEELILEKNKKLVVILGNVVLISLVCLALVLFSLKFYILGEISSEKSFLDNTEKKYQNPDFLHFKNLLQKYNAKLIKIDAFYKKEIYFSGILKTILEIQRPKGLSLISININKTKEDNPPQSTTQKTLRTGNIKVTISGISDTRDNLLIFKRNIENNKEIENLYFPPYDWIKPKDINFYLTFETMQLNKKNENSK